MEHENEIQGEDLRAYLIDLAAGRLESGIIHEPRAFFDIIDLNDEGQITAGHGEVFKNGEQFPIRLTHLSAAVGYFKPGLEESLALESDIQGIGLRLDFHNQNYMNPAFLPVPIWANKVVAAPENATLGTASWRYDSPFVLSARDSMQVDIAVDQIPTIGEDPPVAVPQLVTVTFTGFGMLSGRPYLLSGERELTSVERTTMSTTFFRNDGSEPIIITDGTANIAGLSNPAEPSGDIRNLSLNIRQAGNGTNAFWMQGPDGLPKGELMPATLMGFTTGRAVVHKFPGGGLMWEPGEGISVFARELAATQQAPISNKLVLALGGYITIT